MIALETELVVLGFTAGFLFGIIVMNIISRKREDRIMDRLIEIGEEFDSDIEARDRKISDLKRRLHRKEAGV